MTPILEVKNLKKHYPIRKGLLNKLVGTKYVVDGISFSIEKGKTLALVGESGCGKSVLLRVLLGLEAPTEGEILFHGKDTSQMSSDDCGKITGRTAGDQRDERPEKTPGDRA